MNINISPAQVLFLDAFFSALAEKNIRSAILRNVEEVEQGDAHDVDMTVDARRLTEVESLLLDTASKLGWSLHLRTGSPHDKVNIQCYHFYRINESDGSIQIVHLDIFPTFTWNGWVLLENEKLLEGVQQEKYPRVSAAVEHVTKLFVRLLFNGKVKEKYQYGIREYFLACPENARECMQRFLSDEMAQFILCSAAEGQWQAINDKRADILRDIRKHSRSARLNYKCYLIRKACRRAGLMVALQGTDGSGKTTIIDALPSVLGNSFPKDLTDYYHWRPGFLKSEKKCADGTTMVVSNPHETKPQSFLMSLAKLAFFSLDYLIGYWGRVRWQVAKGHLVVFDRYYYDFYLDKIRYRLKLGNFWVRLFQFFVPEPDITFLLTGDAEPIYERKKEVPLEEVQRQIEALQTYKKCFANPISINVVQPIKKVVNDVAGAVLRTLGKRYAGK